MVQGYGGSQTRGVKQGTIKWRWLDDTGREHTHWIPDSYYVPDGGYRLLSPQHWAQVAPKERRQATTTAEGVRLQWGPAGKYHLTVPLDPSTNVANIPMAAGFQGAVAFLAEAGLDVAMEDSARLIHDFLPPPMHDDVPSQQEAPWCQMHSSLGDLCALDASIKPTPHLIDDWEELAANKVPTEEKKPPAPVIPVQQELIDKESSISTTQEFLRWHQRLGHLAASTMQNMARNGFLPAHLARCEVPVCPSCMAGKAHRRPWRGKSTKNEQGVSAPTQPGQVVSVDQMISSTPGLVAQMSGFLTSKRYKVATVFVDQATRYGYVYFQSTTAMEETALAKRAFEDHARQMGVCIQHYHADNGVFASQAWQSSCAAQGQGLTFAGVNAHHQNGIAECQIRELTEMARSMIIFAQRRWPSAITANLWPYALREANAILTEATMSGMSATPLEQFSWSKAAPKLKYRQPFGCPVYVLNQNLQAPPMIQDKWTERSRV